MLKLSFGIGALIGVLGGMAACVSPESVPPQLDNFIVGTVINMRNREPLCDDGAAYLIQVDQSYNSENASPLSGEEIAVCQQGAGHTDFHLGGHYSFFAAMRTRTIRNEDGTYTILPITIPPFDPDSQRAPTLYQ